MITFLADKISMSNRTVDDQLYGSSYLYGDEINLCWNQSIPYEERNVSLTFDAARLQSALGKIRKKDIARLAVIHTDNNDDEFTIFVSCGSGGDGREGVKPIPATRVEPDNTIIKYPEERKLCLLVIPVKQFRSMVESFSKCKKESITIKFFTNDKTSNHPGMTMTTDVTNIFEKFGEIPDENMDRTSNLNLDIDDSSIVRMTGGNPNVEIQRDAQPNEFVINSDKIPIFTKQASMHNEGNVRVFYQEGRQLRLSHRFGSFGECEICLYNAHTLLN